MRRSVDSPNVQCDGADIERRRYQSRPRQSTRLGNITGGRSGFLNSCKSNAGGFAGYKAEQILRGKEAVRNIPFETLQRFTLVVNMTTAVQFGVYPSLDLIKIAELL